MIGKQSNLYVTTTLGTRKKVVVIQRVRVKEIDFKIAFFGQNTLKGLL